MKKSKFLSLLLLPLMLIACSDSQEIVDKRKIYEWIKVDNEVFEELNAKKGEELIKLPYDKDLFVTFENKITDKEQGTEELIYESNYSLFFSSENNRLMLTLDIDNIDKVDKYFETLKSTTGWVVDEEKTNAEQHDFYAYYDLGYEDSGYEELDGSSVLRANVYGASNLMYVSAYIDTEMVFDSWPEYAINTYLGLDKEQIVPFRSFDGSIEEINFNSHRIGGNDYIELNVKSNDENALENYRTRLLSEVVLNPDAPEAEQIKQEAYKIEKYHIFSSTMVNYYINQSATEDVEGTKFIISSSLNIYLNKPSDDLNQKEFKILLNLDSTFTME